MRRRSSGKEAKVDAREMVVDVGVRRDYTNVSIEDCQTLVVNGVMRHGEVKTERVVVSGKFHGSVEASYLEVTKGALFHGRAMVRKATVAGRLEGVLVASDLLNVKSAAQCQGLLRYGQLNVQHGGKLMGSVKATSDADVGIGDIAVLDLAEGTWDDDTPVTGRGRGSSKGSGRRILRSAGQAGRTSMGSDARSLVLPSGDGVAGAALAGAGAGSRRNRSSAPPPSTSARVRLASDSPQPSDAAAGTADSDVFVASKRRGGEDGSARGSKEKAGEERDRGGSAFGSAVRSHTTGGREGLAVTVGGPLRAIGGDGSLASMESSGWGALREPPAMGGASPDASELDMLEFLQEVGERRMREEAAEEHPTDSATPTSGADSRNMSPQSPDLQQSGMAAFLREFVGESGGRAFERSGTTPADTAAPAIVTASLPVVGDKESSKDGLPQMLSETRGSRDSAEGTDDMSPAGDGAAVNVEWLVATQKAVTAPTPTPSVGSRSSLRIENPRPNLRISARPSPRVSPRPSPILSSGHRTPVKLTEEGARLQKLLFPSAILMDSNAQAPGHHARHSSPTAAAEAALAYAPGGSSQSRSDHGEDNGARLSKTAPMTLTPSTSASEPRGTPASTEPRQMRRRSYGSGSSKGGSTDQSRQDRDREIEEQRSKLRKASHERMLKRRADEEAKAIAAARLVPHGMRISDDGGAHGDTGDGQVDRRSRATRDAFLKHHDSTVTPGSTRFRNIQSPAYSAPQISYSPPSTSLSPPGPRSQSVRHEDSAIREGYSAIDGRYRKSRGTAARPLPQRDVFSSLRVEHGGSPGGVRTPGPTKFAAPSPAGGGDIGRGVGGGRTGGTGGIFIEGMVTPASSWEMANDGSEMAPVPSSTTSSGGIRSGKVSPPSPAGGELVESRTTAASVGRPSPPGMRPGDGGLNFSMHGILKSPKMSRAEAEVAVAAVKAAATRTGGGSPAHGADSPSDREGSIRSIRRDLSMVSTPPSVLSSSTNNTETPATTSARSPPAGPSASQSQRRMQARVRQGKDVSIRGGGGQSENTNAPVEFDRSRLQKVWKAGSRQASPAGGSPAGRFSRSAEANPVRGVSGPVADAQSEAASAARGAAEAAKFAMKAALEAERKTKGGYDRSRYGSFPVVKMNPSHDSLEPMSPLQPRLPTKQPPVTTRDKVVARPSSARFSRTVSSSATAPVSPIVKPRPMSARLASNLLSERSPERSDLAHGRRGITEKKSEDIAAESAWVVGKSALTLHSSSSHDSSASSSISRNNSSSNGPAATVEPLVTASTSRESVKPLKSPTLSEENPVETTPEHAESVELSACEGPAPEGGTPAKAVGVGSDKESKNEGDKVSRNISVNRNDVDSVQDKTIPDSPSSGGSRIAVSTIGSQLPIAGSKHPTAQTVSPSKAPRPLPAGSTAAIISTGEGGRTDDLSEDGVRGAGRAAEKQVAAKQAVAALDAAKSRAAAAAQAANDARRKAEVLQRAAQAAAQADGARSANEKSAAATPETPAVGDGEKSVPLESHTSVDVPPIVTKADSNTFKDVESSATSDTPEVTISNSTSEVAPEQRLPPADAAADKLSTEAPDEDSMAETEVARTYQALSAQVDLQTAEVDVEEFSSNMRPVGEIPADGTPDAAPSLPTSAPEDEPANGGTTLSAETMNCSRGGTVDEGANDDGQVVGDAAGKEPVDLVPSGFDEQSPRTEMDESAVVAPADERAELIVEEEHFPLFKPTEVTSPPSPPGEVKVASPNAGVDTTEPVVTSPKEACENDKILTTAAEPEASVTASSATPLENNFGLAAYGVGRGAGKTATQAALLRRPASANLGRSGGGALGLMRSRAVLSRPLGTTNGLAAAKTEGLNWQNPVGGGKSMPRVGSEGVMAGNSGTAHKKELVAGQAARDRSAFVSPAEVKKGLGPAGAFAGNSNWRVEMSREKPNSSAVAKADGHGGFHNPMAALRATQKLQGGGARGSGAVAAVGSGGRNNITVSPSTLVEGKLSSGLTSPPSRSPLQDSAPAASGGQESTSPLPMPAWMMVRGKTNALRSPTGVLGRRHGIQGQPLSQSPASSPPRNPLTQSPPRLSPPRENPATAGVVPFSVQKASDSREDTNAASCAVEVLSRDESQDSSVVDVSREPSSATNTSQQIEAVDDASSEQAEGFDDAPPAGEQVETVLQGEEGDEIALPADIVEECTEGVVDDTSPALPRSSSVGEGIRAEKSGEPEAKPPMDDGYDLPIPPAEMPEPVPAVAASALPSPGVEEVPHEPYTVDDASANAEPENTGRDQTGADTSQKDAPDERVEETAASVGSAETNCEVSPSGEVGVSPTVKQVKLDEDSDGEGGWQQELGDAPTEETMPRKETPSPGGLAALGRFLFGGPNPPPARFVPSDKPVPRQATSSLPSDVATTRRSSDTTAANAMVDFDEGHPRGEVVLSSGEESFDVSGRSDGSVRTTSGDTSGGRKPAIGFGNVEGLGDARARRLSWSRSPRPRSTDTFVHSGDSTKLFSDVDVSSGNLPANHADGTEPVSPAVEDSSTGAPEREPSASATENGTRRTVESNGEPPAVEDDAAVAGTSDGTVDGNPTVDSDVREEQPNGNDAGSGDGGEIAESEDSSDEVFDEDEGGVDTFSSEESRGEKKVGHTLAFRRTSVEKPKVVDGDVHVPDDQQPSTFGGIATACESFTPIYDSVGETSDNAVTNSDNIASATNGNMTPADDVDSSPTPDRVPAGERETAEPAAEVVADVIEKAAVFDEDTNDNDDGPAAEKVENSLSSTARSNNRHKESGNVVKSLAMSLTAGRRSLRRSTLDERGSNAASALSRSKSPGKPVTRKSRPVLVRTASLLSGERKTGLAALEEEGAAQKAARKALLEETKQRRTAEMKNRPGIFETLRQRSTGNVESSSRESSRRGLSSTLGSASRRRDGKDPSPHRRAVSAKSSSTTVSHSSSSSRRKRDEQRKPHKGGSTAQAESESTDGGHVEGQGMSGDGAVAVLQRKDIGVEVEEDSEDSEEEPDYWAKYGVIDDAALDDTAEIEI